jgi:hypothetical protein
LANPIPQLVESPKLLKRLNEVELQVSGLREARFDIVRFADL